MSRVLLDTNVLVGLLVAERGAPAAEALKQCVVSGDEPCIAPQSVYEFWAVATRPIEANGLGLTASSAHSEVLKLLRAFVLVDEPDDLLGRWVKICVDLDVKGRASHDARLIAFMLGRGILRILTFERARFARFPGIEAVELLGSSG